MEEKNCSNCKFSRLNPCPYLKTTCGPSHDFVKHSPKLVQKIKEPTPEIPLDATGDDIEKYTRDKMKERRKKEAPVRSFKVILFMLLVGFAFVAVFLFKIIRFINHSIIAVVALFILVSVVSLFLKGHLFKDKK